MPEVWIVVGTCPVLTGNVAIALTRNIPAASGQAGVLDLSRSAQSITARMDFPDNPNVSNSMIEPFHYAGLCWMSLAPFYPDHGTDLEELAMIGAVWQLLHDVNWPGPVVIIMHSNDRSVGQALVQLTNPRRVFLLGEAKTSGLSKSPSTRLGQLGDRYREPLDPAEILNDPNPIVTNNGVACSYV